MKKIILLLLISLSFFNTYCQLDINKLKTVTLGQSPAFTNSHIGKIIKVEPNIMCSKGNLYGVKRFTFKNFDFDYLGMARNADFFYIKDSLIYVEINFSFDLRDSLTFKSFLHILFNRLNTDVELLAEDRDTLDIKNVIRTMSNKSSVKDYYKNSYYINNSDNYFQVFISISTINAIPQYHFTLRLDNFNMHKLEDFYVNEVGQLSLSSSYCK